MPAMVLVEVFFGVFGTSLLQTNETAAPLPICARAICPSSRTMA